MVDKNELNAKHSNLQNSDSAESFDRTVVNLIRDKSLDCLELEYQRPDGQKYKIKYTRNRGNWERVAKKCCAAIAVIQKFKSLK